jgi:hypothetical protein
MATKLGIVLADFTTALATQLDATGTTATLQSNVDDDAVTLPDGLIYLTLDGANSSKEHIQAVKTGANLASIYSVSRQGTLTSGAVRKHRIGATVTLTDFATIKYLVDLVKGTTDLDATDPLKYDGTATINNDAQLATKKYVDDTAVAGAPDMNLTTKGVAEEATAAEINAGTQTGGTSAELAVNPKYLKDSEYYTLRPTTDEKAALAGSGTPSASNKFVTADTDALKEVLSNKDATTTLGTSDTKYPTQKAVKTYVDGNPITSTNGSNHDWTMNHANGTQTIAHGLGRTPKNVRISAVINDTYNERGIAQSSGVYNGTTTSCVWFRTAIWTNDSDSGDTATYIVYLIPHSGVGQEATVTVDGTNISLAWTNIGNSPNNVAISLMWEAE